MPSKILKYVKKCDIFGIQPQLYLQKSSHHRSILGGILSVMLIVGFAVFAIYTLVFLEEFNFSSIRSWEEFSPNNDFIELSNKNFLVMFKVSDAKALKMLRVKAFREEISNSNLLSKQEYSFVGCKKETFSWFDYEYKDILKPEEFLCLQTGDKGFQIGGEDFSSDLKKFYLVVETCEGGTECLSANQTEEYFNKGKKK